MAGPSGATGGGADSVTVRDAVKKMWNSYSNPGKAAQGHGRLRLVDTYLLFVLLTGIVQFLYCCLVGSFPFNSFLSGFISTVSCFVLGGKVLSYYVDAFLLHFFILSSHFFSVFETASQSRK